MTDAKVMNPDDCHPACDRCGKPFTARHGTGGSKQKFCSRDCQRTSNRERQRTQRRASYAGPTSAPLGGQPAQNEALSHEPAVAAFHPWETGTLDIADCGRTEFVIALNEGESAGALTSKLGQRRYKRSSIST
jgi:hypothetical protein